MALLDALHERALGGGPGAPPARSPPGAPPPASFVTAVFGGRTRSQVKCCSCGYESNTFEPFLDLSLEITRASSVEGALRRFTEGETLDGANRYRCPRESLPVRAVKRMTVDAPPPALVVQLKRFEFARAGRKISRPVAFGETLDLSPFLSRRPAAPALYDLVGVLVHQGSSMHSGHYFAFARAATGGGEWHRFDDARVATVSPRQVLGQCPYMLFYVRRGGGAGARLPAAMPEPMQAPAPVSPAPAAATPAPKKAKIVKAKAAAATGAGALAPRANGVVHAAPAPAPAKRAAEGVADGAAPAKRAKAANGAARRRAAPAADEDDGATRRAKRALREAEEAPSPQPRCVFPAAAASQRGRDDDPHWALILHD
jgi:ubiquitin carboxyl-terminal hydrolase 36/42